MPEFNHQQTNQLNNVLQTILEAAEHFHQLVKAKEVHQSIFAFSSIVEGCEAVINMKEVPHLQNWTEYNTKMQNLVLDISQLLEQGQLLKISERLQFSFIPLLKNMIQQTETSDAATDDKIYHIGVFSAQRNPRDFYTQERVDALLNESKRQQAQLLFFTSKDVDLDNKIITADRWTENGWERITTPYPDVINNVGGGKRTRVDRRLRREVPFTSFFVGNKFFLPKRMVKYREYAELLVPFTLCRREADVHQFMEKNNSVVFKALGSNRGENIYFVTKKGNRYTILEHKKERILNEEAFNKWLNTVILRRQNSFIIQRYIHTRTRAGEPYHIRAHVQKDGEGQWQLTHIYPRVGDKKSNLSNVATEGRVEDFHTFMIEEYGDIGDTYEQDVLRLSTDVAQHLDKLYGFALDELGIDFAFDENGRCWMHEANNGPQTAYHEEKRAVNTIAYAKYIAENGIFHTDMMTKSTSGRFQARTSKLPVADTDGQPAMGILTGEVVNDDLAVSMAQAAQANGIQLYVFTPADMDLDEILIKGYFFEDNEWVPKIVTYPDVIVDRLKLRGSQPTEWLYEELEDILFTNEWPGRRHPRSRTLNDVASSTQTVADFKTVSKPRDIFRYLELYGRVLLTPEIGPRANGFVIETDEDGTFKLGEQYPQKTYNELPLRNKLKELLQKNKMIVQRDPRSQTDDGQAFTVCASLLMEEDDCTIFNLYADVKPSAIHEGYRDDLFSFLKGHYDDAVHYENEVRRAAEHTATALRDVYGDLISEVGIVMGLNDAGNLQLIDVNPNGPEHVYNPDEMADNVVRYAKSLVDAEHKDTIKS